MLNKRFYSVVFNEILLLVLMSVAVAFIISNQLPVVNAENGEIINPGSITAEGPVKMTGGEGNQPGVLMGGAETETTQNPPLPASAGLPVRATSSQILEQERNAKSIPPLLKQKTQLEKNLKDYEKTLKKYSGLPENNENLKFFKGKYDETAEQLKSVDEKLKNAGYDSTGTAAATVAGTMPVFGFDVPKTFRGHLFAGLAYSSSVYVGLEFFADMFGLDEGQKEALKYGATSGTMAFQLLKGYQTTAGGAGKGVLGLGKKGMIGSRAGLVSAGIGLAIFVATYKDKKQVVIIFTSEVWQPPTGGRDCDKCNNNPFRPCSEYACRSLGQACQIVNPGTDEEKCVWINPHDVNTPTITPWKDALYPEELQYTKHDTRPDSRGTKIINTKTSDKCLQAFTPLRFGITTNEPASCKIDFERKPFDEMQYYVGESNLLLTNHSQSFRLPAPEANTTDSSPILQSDGTFTFFIICQDANGNKNDDDYAVSFCVDPSPDTTPPLIENSSIVSGGYVQAGIDNLTIDVYVNEPAECKWSIMDKGYDDMEHNMTCATQGNQYNAQLLYECSDLLTSVVDQQDNMYYFRCKDQPAKQDNERNTMAQSFALVLRGTQALNIIDTEPNRTIKGATSSVKVDLEVETDDGAESGKAICMFSKSSDEDYVAMFETNSHLHKQTLELTEGDYTYYFRCIDAGGNLANSNTTFAVITDKGSPLVVRAYKEQPDALKIITDEDAECTYSLTSCNFVFEDGQAMLNSPPSDKTTHYAQWENEKTYYIKCKDEFDNAPGPNQCSIVVGASGL